MTERERTLAILEAAEAYDGPDQIGALMASIDCRIELMLMADHSKDGD